ncbi:uncharacterized protein LOC124846838 [Vigna umbellata]|uniref:uncharacterized protein LOC124846838 n=1 Tax=Vigna umbellata TaxID=87088 RepID=UPI001F5EBCB7|nr:uncharacterized protein LOC124846838 [Vigna umbellata]
MVAARMVARFGFEKGEDEWRSRRGGDGGTGVAAKQAKVSNREIKRILEKIVATSRKDWSHKLDDALWAYMTAMKTSMGLSPYQLVYGKACHLPVEMEHKALWALKFMNFDPSETQNKRRRQMLELEEMRLKLFLVKLKSKWSEPFIVKNVRPHGAIELVDTTASDQQRSWVVNGQRLKHYLGGEVEQLSIVMKLANP